MLKWVCPPTPSATATAGLAALQSTPILVTYNPSDSFYSSSIFSLSLPTAISHNLLISNKITILVLTHFYHCTCQPFAHILKSNTPTSEVVIFIKWQEVNTHKNFTHYVKVTHTCIFWWLSSWLLLSDRLKRNLVRNVTVYIAPVQQAFQTMWGFLVGVFFPHLKKARNPELVFLKKPQLFLWSKLGPINEMLMTMSTSKTQILQASNFSPFKSLHIIFTINSFMTTLRKKMACTNMFHNYMLPHYNNLKRTCVNIPFLQFMHVKETIPIFSWQFKLGRYGKHWFIKVPKHSFHCLSILMIVINIVI